MMFRNKNWYSSSSYASHPTFAPPAIASGISSCYWPELEHEFDKYLHFPFKKKSYILSTLISLTYHSVHIWLVTYVTLNPSTLLSLASFLQSFPRYRETEQSYARIENNLSLERCFWSHFSSVNVWVTPPCSALLFWISFTSCHESSLVGGRALIFFHSPPNHCVLRRYFWGTPTEDVQCLYSSNSRNGIGGADTVSSSHRTTVYSALSRFRLLMFFAPNSRAKGQKLRCNSTLKSICQHWPQILIMLLECFSNTCLLPNRRL